MNPLRSYHDTGRGWTPFYGWASATRVIDATHVFQGDASAITTSAYSGSTAWPIPSSRPASTPAPRTGRTATARYSGTPDALKRFLTRGRDDRGRRRLVRLLIQLADAGAAVNLITHSLGARVALTALNRIGAMGERGVTCIHGIEQIEPSTESASIA